MIDLSLTSIDFVEKFDPRLKKPCAFHKRTIIGMCVDERCNLPRLVCGMCVNSKDQHSNHKLMDISELNGILTLGAEQFENLLTQILDEKCTKIVNTIEKVRNRTKEVVGIVASNLSKSFSQQIELNDKEEQNNLFQLIQLITKPQDHPVQNVVHEFEKELFSSWAPINDNIEKYFKKLENSIFKSELRRYDIETQIEHNLSKHANLTYKRLKEQIDSVFSNSDFVIQNLEDSRLYLVNDNNFYTISNFDSEGKRHGRTIEIPSESNFYIGSIEHGKRSGWGVYIYQDGSSYVGQFKNNTKHGKGKLVKSDGYQYEGEWENDLKSGAGKEKFQNEWEFEGFFSQNLREGPGTQLNNTINKVTQAIYEKDNIKTVLSTNSVFNRK